MKQITVRISVNYMRANLEKYIADRICEGSEYNKNAAASGDWKEKLDWEKYWETAESKILNFLDNFTICDNYIKYLENNRFIKCDEKQLSKVIKLVRERFDYSEVVWLTLSDGIIEALCDVEEKIWSYLLEKYYLFWLEVDTKKAEKEKQELKYEVNKLIRKGNSYSPWNSEMFSVSVAIKKVMYLFQECSADLIGILTLRISMKNYLKTIVQSTADQGFTGNFEKSILQIRSSIITFCMQKKTGDFFWSEADLKEFEDTNETEYQKLNEFRKEIVRFIKTYLNKGCDGKVSEKIPRMAIDALLSTDILIFMIKYLSECRDIFEKQNSEKMQGLQKKLMGAYKIFDCDNIEEIEQGIQGYLEQYSKELRDELKKHIREDI